MKGWRVGIPLSMKMSSISFLFLFILCIYSFNSPFGQDRSPISANRYELLSGESRRMPLTRDEDVKSPEISVAKSSLIHKFLEDNYQYIPKGARVLEVGMGSGHNTVFLGSKGFKVVGLDVSSIAVLKAKSLAREKGIQIRTMVGSPETANIEEESFDAIISFYQSKRKMGKRLHRWLKPGGILIIESYTHKQLTKKGFEYYPKEDLFAEGELFNFFSNFKMIKFEEPTHLENFTTSAILQKKR